MKAKRLFEAIGEIDEKHIQQAWKHNKARTWRYLLPAAACLLLVLGAALAMNWPAPENGPAGDLPMLHLDGDQSDSMGFEGYAAYQIDELISANPWQKGMTPEALPVYKNITYSNIDGRSHDGDMEAMTAWALEFAGRFGLSDEEITLGDNRPSDEVIAILEEKLALTGEKLPKEYLEPTQITVQAQGIEISVDATLTATIHFNPAVSLPEGYNFTHFASYEDTQATGAYLLEEYKALLGMREPVLCVDGGGYNIYGQQAYDISFYEGAGSLEEQIVSYNLCRAYFHCDDDGKLFLARIKAAPPSEKLGNYPLISEDEAEKLLEAGNYTTTLAEQFPGLAYVRRVELIYRNSRDAILLPYYRFYVEMPGMENRGRNTYGAYYVPAVQGQYIQSMPLWNGSFN